MNIIIYYIYVCVNNKSMSELCLLFYDVALCGKSEICYVMVHVVYVTICLVLSKLTWGSMRSFTCTHSIRWLKPKHFENSWKGKHFHKLATVLSYGIFSYDIGVHSIFSFVWCQTDHCYLLSQDFDWLAWLRVRSPPVGLVLVVTLLLCYVLHVDINYA